MRKILPLSVLVFLSSFLLSGCFDTPKDFVSPNWDVELNVPITEKEYKLAELLDPSKNIRIGNEQDGGDSLYVLLVNDINSTFLIQDDITIPIHLFPEQLKIQGTSVNGVPVDNALIYNPEPQYHITSAVFKSGSISAKLNNNGETTVNYELVLPGFKNSNDNSMLIQKGTLSAHQSKDIKFDLQNCVYSELKIVEGYSDKKKYTCQGAEGFFIVGKASAEGSSIDIDFNSDVTSDKITISKMVGRLKPTELPYVTHSIKTSFGNDISDFAKIDFKNMTMNLNTHTFGEMKNIKIKMDSLSIIGFKRSSSGQKYSPVPLLFQGQQVYSMEFVAGASNTLTTFDKSNSNLIEFIRNLPQEIEIKSKAILESNSNAYDSVQVVSNKDSVRFSVDINAPLIISSNDVSYKDTINIDDELKPNERDDIVKANNANVTFEIENHIPLGAVGKATFVDQNYNNLFSMRSKVGSTVSDQLSVDPAQANNDGVSSAPGIGKMTLFLDKSEIEKFKIAKYIIVELKMRSYNYNVPGTYVQVRAKDYVKLKLYGGVNYHLDPEDEKDNGGK